MYTIDKYITDTLMLVDSLSIKNNDVAVKINEGLVLNHGLTIPIDPKQWKYYMNLAGLKHSTNNSVFVYVTKTATTEELTLTLLATNSLLKEELRKKGTLYTNLIADYPNDIEYIKGMLYQADLNTITTVPDGTIVSYDKSLIKDNELNLIRELNSYIMGFLARWYLRDYTIVDELYLTSMLGVLYASLPTVIMNIRLSKIMTNEVHDFHLYNYFKSRLNLSDDIDILEPKSKIWLYNNINYIMNNIGKNEILTTVIEHIFTTNSIGVGAFTIQEHDIVVPATNIDIPTVPLYQRQDPIIERKALNTFYKDSGIISSVSDTINNEIVYDNTKETKTGDNVAIFMANNLSLKDKNTLRDEHKTKLLEIETNSVFNLTGVDMIEVVIDNMLYKVFNQAVDFYINYTDPNTNRTYKLTLKDTVYLLLTMLQKVLGVSKAISTYKYSTVVDPNISKAVLTRNIVPDAENSYVVEELLKYMPSNSIVTSKTIMTYLFSNIKDYYIKNSILMANLNTPKLVNNLKTLNNVINLRGVIDLSINGEPAIPDDILISHGVNYITPSGYDYVLAINALLFEVTGINVDNYVYVNERINKYTNILDKLTSYTTQVIKNASINKSIDVKHTTMTLSKGDSGVISILDAEEINVLHTPLTEHTIMKGNNKDFAATSRVAFDVAVNIV